MRQNGPPALTASTAPPQATAVARTGDRSAATARVDCVQIHLPHDWPDQTSNERAGTVQWTWRNGLQTGGDSGRIEDLPRARDYLLVVPGSRVLTLRARLPAGRAGRQSNVLGNAVEEMLAVPPDAVWVTVLEARADGTTLLAVLDKAWLCAVLDTLALQGVVPARVTSEIEGLTPQGMGQWSMVRQASGGFVHLGGLESLPLDGAVQVDLPAQAATEAPLALQLLATERLATGTPGQGLRVFSASGLGTPDWAAWSEQLSMPVSDAGPWQTWPPGARPRQGIDLGAGLNRRPRTGAKGLGAYRVPLAIATGILLTHLALTALDNWRMAREIVSLRDGMEARFRQMFPETRAIADPVLQMRRLHEARAGGSGASAPEDFLSLMGQLANPMAATGARASAVRFDAGILVLELAFPPGTTLDTIEPAFKVEGLRITIEHVGAVPAPTAGANARPAAGSTTATLRVAVAP